MLRLLNVDPQPPHQCGMGGGWVKNDSIFSAVHEIFRIFETLTPKKPQPQPQGGVGSQHLY